jgi:Transposase DDE domain group 1
MENPRFMHDNTRQSVLFKELVDKSVVARFDQPQASSDGGAILLKACDQKLRLTERLTACLVEKRQDAKIRHTLEELIRQRLYGIACGYEDANDATRLSNDPIQKLLVGRDAVTGEALASQPTLSRFENGVGRKEAYQLGQALAETVIERHRRRLGKKVRRITVDLDPTDDPTHGSQQLSFFNGHYDTWCYLPMAGFISFNQEVEQYLFTYMLRPGNAPATLGAQGLLRRLFERLRQAFPRARLRVRLDGGFASGELFDFLEDQGVEYVVAMAKNAVLQGLAEPLMVQARVLAKTSNQTEHVYGECVYQAGKWTQPRRVIIKAEQVRHPGRDPKDNPRFVVTNLKSAPKKLYERIYCARGEIENRIKELHHGLQIDRTSCTRFWANQLRVLLTAAAYVLFQELRWRARNTSCARAQVATLRERLFKLGVWIESSVRRFVLHLPLTSPYAAEWRQIAHALGAESG